MEGFLDQALVYDLVRETRQIVQEVGGVQTGVLGSRVIVADGIVNQVIHPVALPQLEPALEEGSLNFDQLDEPPARHRIGTGLPVAKVASSSETTP